MREYRKHLTDGRLFAGKAQWPEAIKSFEKALEAVPGDAPALTELGWAAFKAGELDRAKKANEEAVRRTTSPKIQGMALYNLGRVAEAQKDTKTAIEHYRKSLELRPNEIVEKRLAELTKGEKAKAPAAEALPCQTPAAKLEDMCACLVKATASPDDPSSPEPLTCAPMKDVKIPRPEISAVEVQTSMFHADFYVVEKRGEGFVPVGKLGFTHNPGAFGIFEELEVTSVTEKTAGKTPVLWFDVSHARHDSDMGIDEMEDATTTSVTICVPPQGEAKAWKCPFTTPLKYEYTRERMGLEGFTPDAETRKLMTKGLPIKETWALDAKLGEGKVEVSVASGKPPAYATKHVGTHTL